MVGKNNKGKHSAGKKNTKPKGKPVSKPKAKSKAVKSTAKTKKPAKTQKQKKTTKKSKSEKKVSLVTYISLGFIVTAIIAYGGFFVFNIVKQARADDYNRAIYEIQLRTNKKMAKLSPMFSQFVATPDAAKKIGPKFKDAADATRRGALALKTLTPPSDQKKNHVDLLKSYERATGLYNDLEKLSSYLTKRDKVIKNYVKALKNFAKKMTDAKRRKEVLEIATNAEINIAASLYKMKKIESPIEIYDDKLLIKYTKALAKHLKDLREALSKNKTKQIKTALDDISQDYSLNWQKAFFNADKSEIKKYNQRVEDIQSLYRTTSAD